MKRIFLIILLVISNYSLACECSFGTKLEKHYEQADFIFYAEVKKILDSKAPNYSETLFLDPNYTKHGGYIPEVKILSIYKNKTNKLKINQKLTIDQEFSNCDFFFKKNKKYVVFGYEKDNGKITTSVCVPTGLISKEEDLKVIKTIAARRRRKSE